MEQLFAVFETDNKLYPVTQLIWNTWNGELLTVVCSTPYNIDQPNIDFVFNVVESTSAEIKLQGVLNKQFKATIFL